MAKRLIGTAVTSRLTDLKVDWKFLFLSTWVSSFATVASSQQGSWLPPEGVI